MTAKRHRHEEHEEHEGGMERWLLTYADMITLLLALFVVLFAMSSINIKKFLELKVGLTQTFNPSAISTQGSNGLLQQSSLVSQAGSGTQTTANTTATATSNASARNIAQQITRALAAKGLTQDAAVQVTQRGVVVQILADKVFFALDSASLGSAGDAVVDTIAGVVRPDTNHVVVQGYTDNIPITGGPYHSNWELSAVRAANVADRLNVVDGINANRLQALGFGSTHPAVPNITPANQAKNRRIDVVILNN
jgi:chemotaxis protein MotB